MIMFTMTAPRRKLKRALQAGGLVLLLAAVVPGIYCSLTEAEAMSSFADGSDTVAGGQTAVTDDTADSAAEGTTEGITDSTTENAAESTAESTANNETAADGDGAPGTEGAKSLESIESTDGSFLQSLREALFGPEQQVEMY